MDADSCAAKVFRCLPYTALDDNRTAGVFCNEARRIFGAKGRRFVKCHVFELLFYYLCPEFLKLRHYEKDLHHFVLIAGARI